ncbi:MAG TPA: DUF3147 family protein [Candidatus Mcinerneyibacteriales bacterium]|nr:DUF3147 family protein [Candidatus Mcinerneyibacteriales bacterium]
MLFYLVKVILSALIIVLVSEISKRSSLMGALLASLPLTSLLAILWIYIETKNTETIRALSLNVFWLVLPSLLFFLALPFLIKVKIPFFMSLFLSSSLTVAGYLIMVHVMKKMQ